MGPCPDPVTENLEGRRWTSNWPACLIGRVTKCKCYRGACCRGKAKCPRFREHDVTHLCVVLYLHAKEKEAHEYNLIIIKRAVNGLWNGNKEKEAISCQKCVSK